MTSNIDEQPETASQSTYSQVEGVQIKELKTLADERGFFREAMKVTDSLFEPGLARLSHLRLKAAIPVAWWVQPAGVVWCYVPQGTVQLVLYDDRPGSTSRGRWGKYWLGENELAGVVRIPAGVIFGCQAQVESNFVLVSDPSANQSAVQPAQLTVTYQWEESAAADY